MVSWVIVVLSFIDEKIGKPSGDIMQKIVLVAGARPNFMKIAPILRVLDEKYSDVLSPVLVHTGQHYDSNMSESFFRGLGIKTPDYNLDVGSASHAVQTARVMTRFEEVCEREKPQHVLVVGDVNSTIAAGLVAKKTHICLSHVEAGLRSFDRRMPEEINRLATDAISDYFFVTEKTGRLNLLREGHCEENVQFVGHVMIDNLFYQLQNLNVANLSQEVLGIKEKLLGKYLCLTLHRPSNVDHPEMLKSLVQTLARIAEAVPIVFPCHPRTRSKMKENGLLDYCQTWNQAERLNQGLILLDPLAYDDFLYLWKDATAVLTDSGGLQEETTALNIPCLTLRENTERPITVEEGSNILVGQKPKVLEMEAAKILEGLVQKGKVPELWDGKASERIVNFLSGLKC